MKNLLNFACLRCKNMSGLKHVWLMATAPEMSLEWTYTVLANDGYSRRIMSQQEKAAGNCADPP